MNNSKSEIRNPKSEGMDSRVPRPEFDLRALLAKCFEFRISDFDLSHTP
jgi:hypothetical protein